MTVTILMLPELHFSLLYRFKIFNLFQFPYFFQEEHENLLIIWLFFRIEAFFRYHCSSEQFNMLYITMSHFIKRHFNYIFLLVFSLATCSFPVMFSDKKCEHSAPWFHACYISFFYMTEVIVFIEEYKRYFSSLVFRRPNFSYGNARKKHSNKMILHV